MRLHKTALPRLMAGVVLVTTLALSPAATPAAPRDQITTPKEQFGFNLGDDYHLANFAQLTAYWKKLARESDRMSLEEIGTTAEGRTMLMAILTSPANHRDLARYRTIARRLALAEGLSDEEARALASDGKAVVWIDGGLHATETLGAQQLMELVYQMASRDDPETLRFLHDDILLAVCVNPDGLDLVADWYMRNPDPHKRSTRGLPRLYQKYVGHDNNRDFYMSNQPETEAINRILYRRWFPQIVYNHHQTGPAGTVLFAPPFRNPFNYNYDPLVPLELDMVGSAMHSRFAAEGKPGATMRSGSSYSTWWNGGLRTTPYFHNMIGLLTETVGNPTPTKIPFVPQRQLPNGDQPYPVAPQEWHLRQSIEYSITANRAVLDIASRERENFLYNIYRMGKNSIERGSRDHWTIHPQRIAAVEAAVTEAKNKGNHAGSGSAPSTLPGGDFRGANTVPAELYETILHAPGARDPRGFILPSDQPDFLTATKFVNALIKNGITVHRAPRDFSVAGREYPAGSYVVLAAQAFRPFVMDAFEPQDHPDDIPYPGGPPTPPYDVTGWTLAYQMGVRFDRILDGFAGPFEKIEGLAETPRGLISHTSGAVGFLLSHQVNDAFIAVNEMLASGEEVYWLRRSFRANGKSYEAGTIYIPARPSTLKRLQDLARERGLTFAGTSSAPNGPALGLRPVRIGLWDRYGGSIPSGWTRWLLEQFEFPYEVVYPPTLDAGNLSSRYDVLIFDSGAIPQSDNLSQGRFRRGGAPPEPAEIPPEYRDRLGSTTISKTVPQLRQFLEDGGTVVAIGSSTSIAAHLGLPIENALLERLPDGTVRPLPREKYYVPGSVLEVHVDNHNPLAYGMSDRAEVFFRNSPVFKLRPNAAASGVNPVAWFGDKPLRSGWAWGEGYLEDGVAAIAATVGRGKLFLFGPEIDFRAQPHGTFKLLFNGIYLSTAQAVDAIKP
ncbi:MAG: M14 metallopeptidase family protein [Acidobacteriota bacterium]